MKIGDFYLPLVSIELDKKKIVEEPLPKEFRYINMPVSFFFANLKKLSQM